MDPFSTIQLIGKYASPDGQELVTIRFNEIGSEEAWTSTQPAGQTPAAVWSDLRIHKKTFSQPMFPPCLRERLVITVYDLDSVETNSKCLEVESTN